MPEVDNLALRNFGEDEPQFTRLDLAPAYRVVFETIEREILEGRLKPGDRLPSETALAQQLGVHRSTTREGLRLLEQSGLVQRRGGRRLFAAVPRQDELATRASRALVLQQVTFNELWQLLMALEPAAATMACETITPEEITALEDNLMRTRQVVAEGASFAKLDLEFHAIIAGATRNRAWLLAREPAAMLLFPADELMLPYLPQAGHRLIEAHMRILAALKNRDGAMAEEWMRKHVIDFRRGYETAGLSLDDPIHAWCQRPGGNQTN